MRSTQPLNAGFFCRCRHHTFETQLQLFKRFLQTRNAAVNFAVMSNWGNRTLTGRTEKNAIRGQKVGKKAAEIAQPKAAEKAQKERKGKGREELDSSLIWIKRG
jgi:hypothetical protein